MLTKQELDLLERMILSSDRKNEDYYEALELIARLKLRGNLSSARQAQERIIRS